MTVATAEKLRFSFPNFLRRRILDIACDCPVETERISDVAVAVPPELVGKRHHNFASCRECLLEYFVDIRHVQVKPYWKDTLSKRRPTHLRKMIIEHQVGIADAHVNVHQ